jgi:hypothetical protein
VATTVEEAQVLFSASGIGKVETAASKANSVMNRMSSVAGKAVRSIKGIAGAAMSFRGLVGMAAVGVAAKKAADAAGEQIAAERKLESVLAATGNAAGFTADELKRMAADLQQVTNYGDEATLSAMGVLASFTNIKGDVFRDATTAAQDLSAVMGQDLQSSVVQIGKALNDPIKGVTALQRVGVAFTQQQKDQITAMVEAGNSMGAQQLILAELKKEFGGAAEAMADPFTQFGNAVGDVQEELGMLVREIGTELLPVGYQLLEWTSSAISGMKGIGVELKTFVTDGIDAFTQVQDSIADFVTFNTIIAGDIGNVFQGLFDDIVGWAQAAFDYISANIKIAIKNSQTAGSKIANKLSFGMLGSDAGTFQEFQSFAKRESATMAAAAAAIEKANTEMFTGQSQRIQQRADAAERAGAAAAKKPVTAAGVSLVPRMEIEDTGPAEPDTTADTMEQAATALQNLAAQRGSALQSFQRIQESLQKRSAELAEQQLAEQQKQTALAEKQLTIMEKPQPMLGAVLS